MLINSGYIKRNFYRLCRKLKKSIMASTFELMDICHFAPKSSKVLELLSLQVTRQIVVGIAFQTCERMPLSPVFLPILLKFQCVARHCPFQAQNIGKICPTIVLEFCNAKNRWFVSSGCSSHREHLLQRYWNLFWKLICKRCILPTK